LTVVQEDRPPLSSKPLMPHQQSQRRSVTTRNLPGGSPVFDKIFPCAMCGAIGCSIGMFLAMGHPDLVKFSTRGINHPLFNGAILGFCVGMLLSPIGLWIKRNKKSGRVIFPVAIFLGFALGFGLGLRG